MGFQHTTNIKHPTMFKKLDSLSFGNFPKLVQKTRPFPTFQTGSQNIPSNFRSVETFRFHGNFPFSGQVTHSPQPFPSFGKCSGNLRLFQHFGKGTSCFAKLACLPPSGHNTGARCPCILACLPLEQRQGLIHGTGPADGFHGNGSHLPGIEFGKFVVGFLPFRNLFADDGVALLLSHKASYVCRDWHYGATCHAARNALPGYLYLASSAARCSGVRAARASSIVIGLARVPGA